jgi:hypothetical protein
MAKKVTDYEVFKDNPFQEGLKGKIRGYFNRGESRVRKVRDEETGKASLLSDIKKGEFVLTDNEQFTKLYTPIYDQIRKLPTPGVKMLSYVLYLASKNTEWVKISTTLAKEWCGYDSSSNVYLGIASLLEHKFICRKIGNNSEYFININYFFNGQRTCLDYAEMIRARAMETGRLSKDEQDTESEEE